MSKVKVFISWSGTVSRGLAEAFRDWLPSVIQAVKPWMSGSDIDKGVRWSSEIAAELEEARVGLICLTPDNLEKPWILFEAGALSKTLEKTFVCPYLFGLRSADLQFPLAQFQATKAEKEDTRKLIHTINSAFGESRLTDDQVNKSFERCWPEFEERLKALELSQPATRSQRESREILEEILELARTTVLALAHDATARDSTGSPDPLTPVIGRRRSPMKRLAFGRERRFDNDVLPPSYPPDFPDAEPPEALHKAADRPPSE